MLSYCLGQIVDVILNIVMTVPCVGTRRPAHRRALLLHPHRALRFKVRLLPSSNTFVLYLYLNLSIRRAEG